MISTDFINGFVDTRYLLSAVSCHVRMQPLLSYTKQDVQHKCGEQNGRTLMNAQIAQIVSSLRVDNAGRHSQRLTDTRLRP